MCCSLRGFAFFGASVHLAVGVILFLRYVIASVIFTFYNFNNLFSEKVTAFVAPFMVYVTVLLVLGVLIFHSIEREYFFLLKWSSLAFSLLQVIVFVSILVLKLSPNYQYHHFPLLPESLVPTSNHHSKNPAGPEVIFAVPHGAKIDEKDFTIIRPSSRSPSSSDPPDPGGGGKGKGNSSTSRQELYRLTLSICCVLLTLIYLVFLFLYIRQLHSGNVFGLGHAHAGAGPSGHTFSRAFYVHPQTTGTNQDNNDNSQQSQTQIPTNFLPNQNQSQSPKKVLNQVGGQGEGSPRRQHLLQNLSSGYSASPNRSLTVPDSHLPILGPSASPGQGSSPLPPMGMRGPIPSAVRIGFYAQDVKYEQQGGGIRSVSPQNIRQRPYFSIETDQGTVISQRELRGPPPSPPPGGRMMTPSPIPGHRGMGPPPPLQGQNVMMMTPSPIPMPGQRGMGPPPQIDPRRMLAPPPGPGSYMGPPPPLAPDPSRLAPPLPIPGHLLPPQRPGRLLPSPIPGRGGSPVLFGGRMLPPGPGQSQGLGPLHGHTMPYYRPQSRVQFQEPPVSLSPSPSQLSQYSPNPPPRGIVKPGHPISMV